MRQTRIFIILAAAVLMTAAPLAPAQGAADSEDAIPVVQFADRVFAFSPVVEGTEVVHGFVVRNAGNAELKINKIKTG